MLRWSALVLVCSTFYISACTLGGAPAADPKQVLDADATAIAAVKSAIVELKFGPGATYNGLEIVSASGKVKLPDASDTTIKAKQSSDSLIELELITLDGHVYLKAPFLGFLDITGQTGGGGVPSVDTIFNPKTGLPAVLVKGRNLATQGSETVDGKDCWKVTGTYAPAQVADAVQLLAPKGDVDATLWVAKDDHLLRKAVLKGNLFQTGKKTSLEIRLHDFNANFEIVKPPI